MMNRKSARKHRRKPCSGFVFAAMIAVCFSLPTLISPQNTNLVVEVATGKVRGVTRPTGGVEFLGISYAQPPVGKLRWHEPLPAKPWKGVREAGSFGAPCSQPVLLYSPVRVLGFVDKPKPAPQNDACSVGLALCPDGGTGRRASFRS